MMRKWLHVTGAMNGTTFPVKESQQMSSRTPKFHGHAVNVIRLAYACYAHACRLNVIQVTSFFFLQFVDYIIVFKRGVQ